MVKLILQNITVEFKNQRLPQQSLEFQKDKSKQ